MQYRELANDLMCSVRSYHRRMRETASKNLEFHYRNGAEAAIEDETINRIQKLISDALDTNPTNKEE